MKVIYWLTLRGEPWAIWGAREWVRSVAGVLFCTQCERLKRARYPEPIDAWIREIERNRSVGGLRDMRLRLIHVRLLERLRPFLEGFVFGNVYRVKDAEDTKGRLLATHRTVYTDPIIFPRPAKDAEDHGNCPECGLNRLGGYPNYIVLNDLANRHVWQCDLSWLYVSQTVADALDWSEFKDLEPRPIPVLDRPLDNLRLPGDPDWEALPPLSDQERRQLQVFFEGGLLEPPPPPRKSSARPPAPDANKIRKALERYKLNPASVDFVMQRLRPGFALEHADKTVKPMSAVPLGSSRLGGVPDMPADWEWPVRPGGPPLAFLCQLDLEEAAGIMALETPLPERGHLYFFYDNTIGEQPWGGEPEECSGWRVLFSEAESEQLRRTPWPEGLPEESQFDVRRVQLKPVLFLPSGATLDELLSPPPGPGTPVVEVVRWAVASALQAAAGKGADALAELRAAVEDERYGAWAAKLNGAAKGRPDHRFLGHPQEEQLAMPSGFAGLVAERPDREVPDPMRPGSTLFIPGRRADAWPAWARELLGQTAAEDWRLLLQLDSEGWMWGDCGKLYFWIPRAALAARQFDKTWIQLQSG